MKKIFLLALSILTVGCVHSADECHLHDGSQHCHNYPVAAHATTPVVITSGNGGGYNNNIIVIEEQPMFQCNWEMPYWHDPEWCDYEYGATYCMWLNIGQEEVWVYTESCGWQLSEIYTYY